MGRKVSPRHPHRKLGEGKGRLHPKVTTERRKEKNDRKKRIELFHVERRKRGKFMPRRKVEYHLEGVKSRWRGGKRDFSKKKKDAHHVLEKTRRMCENRPASESERKRSKPCSRTKSLASTSEVAYLRSERRDEGKAVKREEGCLFL